MIIRRASLTLAFAALALFAGAARAADCCRSDADCAAANGGDATFQCVALAAGDHVCARLTTGECAASAGTPCGTLTCSGDTPYCIEWISGVAPRPPYQVGIQYDCAATPPGYPACFPLSTNVYECQGL